MDCLSGEMIDGQASKIHRSIYSSRADHKRWNDVLERRLTLELEPLMVLATRFGIGYQKTLLDNLWRTMTRNHAHDSAGACNTDKTNKIILERFEQVDQMSGSACDYLVRKLAESQPALQNGSRITLFNTLPFSRSQVQTMTLSTKSGGFSLSTLKARMFLLMYCPKPGITTAVSSAIRKTMRRMAITSRPPLRFVMLCQLLGLPPWC